MPHAQSPGKVVTQKETERAGTNKESGLGIGGAGMVLWTSRQNRQGIQICHRKTHCMAKPNAKEAYWVKSKCVHFGGLCQGYANKRV